MSFQNHPKPRGNLRRQMKIQYIISDSFCIQFLLIDCYVLNRKPTMNMCVVDDPCAQTLFTTNKRKDRWRHIYPALAQDHFEEIWACKTAQTICSQNLTKQKPISLVDANQLSRHGLARAMVHCVQTALFTNDSVWFDLLARTIRVNSKVGYIADCN